MKHFCLLLTSICLANIFFTAEALDVNKKMGKPTDEELSMTTYAPAPDADAVKLYSNTDVQFEFTTDFVVVYRIKERIKVLKPEGASAADVVIIFYDPEESGAEGDRISGIKGSAYNVEEGKVVRSKLTGDLKTKERIDKYHSQVKFSIPNVRVGTVIEYEFQRQSPYIYSISDWYAQCAMPVFFTEYTITIPEWFNFNTEQRGRATLSGKREPGDFKAVVGGGLLTCNATVSHFEGSELPAVKDDDHVWCVEDYMSKVEHDLRSISITGAYYKNFQTRWEDVDKMLLGDADFGRRLNMDNPLAKEQADLHLEGLTVREQTTKLRDLLLAYYRWDNTYDLYCLSPKKLQKEGSANSCTLNFALLSMLRDAGITACPVVLSRRSKGRLPYAHASVSALNTVVLAVADAADSTVFYVDAAAKGYPVGSLPPDELVDRGRMLNKAGDGRWVDLRNCCQGKVVALVTAKVSPDGTLSGDYGAVYHGVSAGQFRDIYRDVTDSADYVQRFATSRDVEIDSYVLERADENSDDMSEELSFTRTLETDGDHIYLNPFLFIVPNGDFKAETRDLPIEFSCPVMERRTVQLTLPEGYEVEELPASVNLMMPDQSMNCRIRFMQAAGGLTLSYIFGRKSLLYDVEDYTYLRDFFAGINAKLGEMIVLKKTAL